MTNGHSMDDDLELLDRCVAGDRDAFNELVLKHQKPLYSMLYRMVSDADDAADILQKTFVKAFTGIKGFERRSSFRTWLYQIAINLAKNLYRDRARGSRISRRCHHPAGPEDPGFADQEGNAGPAVQGAHLAPGKTAAHGDAQDPGTEDLRGDRRHHEVLCGNVQGQLSPRGAEAQGHVRRIRDREPEARRRE